jgi:hypothetical protein
MPCYLRSAASTPQIFQLRHYRQAAIPRQHGTGDGGGAGVARAAASAAFASTTPVAPANGIDVKMFIACPTHWRRLLVAHPVAWLALAAVPTPTAATADCKN